MNSVKFARKKKNQHLFFLLFSKPKFFQKFTGYFMSGKWEEQMKTVGEKGGKRKKVFLPIDTRIKPMSSLCLILSDPH